MKFLQTIVSDKGANAILEFNGSMKNYWVDFSDTEAVQNILLNIERRGSTAYFALGAFAPQKSELTTYKGRTKDNVVSLRSLWLDIDAGPIKTAKLNGHAKETVYADADEALEALAEALEATHILPPTHIVASGFGLHVYWAFTEDLDPETWAQVSRVVVDRLLAVGLRIDHSRVGDTASILRPVSTLHNEASKHLGREVRVEELASHAPIDPADLVASAIASPVKPVTRAKRATSKTVVEQPKTGSILDKITPERIQASLKRGELAPPPDSPANRKQLEVLLEHVSSAESYDGGWLETIFALHHLYQNGWDEEYLVSLLIEWSEPNAHDENFDEAIVKAWRSAERGYDGKQTTIGSLIHKAKENGLPEDWRFFTEGGEPREESVVTLFDSSELAFTLPPMPQGFTKRKGELGLWYTEQTGGGDDDDDDSGDSATIKVLNHDVYVIERSASSSGSESLSILMMRPHDAPKQVRMPMSTLSTLSDFRKFLADQGVLPNYGDKGWKILSKYLLKQTQEWVARKEATKHIENFGWKTDGSFVLGAMRMKPDGSLEPVVPNDDIKAYIDELYPKGSLEEWRKAPNLYAYPGMEHAQFCVLLSMGAPLYAHTGLTGGLCNFYASTGAEGKSTAARVAMSVWGMPGSGARASQLISAASTGNGMFVKMSHMGSLPCIFDEVTNPTQSAAVKDLRDFALRCTSGKQKERMVNGRNALRQNTATWSTFAITTANRSMDSIIADDRASASSAERRRILDVPFPSTGAIGEAHYSLAYASEVINATLPNNYGMAGMALLKAYITRGEEMHRRVTNAVAELTDLCGSREVAQQSNYQMALIAVALVARDIASELGLVEYPREPLLQFCRSLLVSQLADVSQQSYTGEDMFNEFLRQLNPRIIGVKTVGIVSQIIGGHVPRDPVVARWDINDNRLSIVRTELKAFCSERRYDIGQLEEWFASCDSVVSSNTRVSLMKGIVGMASGQVRCYVIDMNKTGINAPEEKENEE